MRLTSLYRSALPVTAALAWIWCATGIVFVSAWISHGQAAGTRGALAVFLSWAITRELAPRRWLASALAPFAGVAFAIPADTDVLSCVVVLLAARVAARSVGDPPSRLDALLLIGLSAGVAMRPVGLPVALVLAAIVFSDASAPRSRLTGTLMLIATLVVGSVEGTLTPRGGWDHHTLAAQVLMAVSCATAVVLIAWPLPKQLRVRDDRRRGRLRGTRIRAARIAVFAAVLASIPWIGTSAVFELSAASAALLAAGLGGAGARAHVPRSARATRATS